MDSLPGYNYWIVILLMMTGLYVVMSCRNLLKKIVGLNIFQASVFVFYISIAKVSGGTAPIFKDGIDVSSRIDSDRDCGRGRNYSFGARPDRSHPR